MTFIFLFIILSFQKRNIYTSKRKYKDKERALSFFIYFYLLLCVTMSLSGNLFIITTSIKECLNTSTIKSMNQHDG